MTVPRSGAEMVNALEAARTDDWNKALGTQGVSLSRAALREQLGDAFWDQPMKHGLDAYGSTLPDDVLLSAMMAYLVLLDEVPQTHRSLSEVGKRFLGNAGGGEVMGFRGDPELIDRFSVGKEKASLAIQQAGEEAITQKVKSLPESARYFYARRWFGNSQGILPTLLAEQRAEQRAREGILGRAGLL